VLYIYLSVLCVWKRFVSVDRNAGFRTACELALSHLTGCF